MNAMIKIVSCLLLPFSLAWGDTATWTGAEDNFLGNGANWEEGTPPANGADILFNVAGKAYNQDIEGFAPRSILFTNENATARYDFSFNNLPFTAGPEGITLTVHAANYLTFNAGFAGTGTARVIYPEDPKQQIAVRFLNGNGGFAGKLVLDGRIYSESPDRHTGVGDDDPGTVIPDAITLDNLATLKNYMNDLTIPAWQGITLGEKGGGFIVGWGNGSNEYRLTVNGPITGPGRLYIGNCYFPVVLNGEGTWRGGTEIGSMAVGGAWNGDNGSLVLGESATFPEGGDLIVGVGGRAAFDLNGHSITVSNLVLGTGATLRNSSTEPVVIHAQEASLNSYRLEGAITIDCPAIRWMISEDTEVAGQLITVEAGTTYTLADVTASGGIPIQLNGGTLALPASNGFAESVIPQWDLRSYYYPVDAILTRAEMGFSNELPEYTTYQYKTQWYIPESRLFRFCKNFDDGARLRIDGVDLLLDTTAGSTVTKENYPLSAGWHDVTLWYGNGAGASGPTSTFRNGLLWGWPGETLQTDGRTFDILDGTFVFAPVIDRTLLVGPGGGSVVLAPQEALTATPSIILRGGVVMTEAAAPTDTVAFDGDVIIGSQDPAKVAVFDAAVALPSDKSLTFTGYVWLKRQPPEGFKVVDGTVFFLSEATRALQEELVGAGGSIGLAPFNFDAYPEPTVTVATNKELNLYSGSLSAGIQPSLLDSEPVVCDKGFAVAEEGYLNFRNSAAWQQDGAIAGEGKIWAEGTGTVRFAADNSAFTGGLTLDNPETVFPSVASAGAATATVWAFSRVQFDDPAASEESGATYPQHFQVSDGATLSCVKKVTLGSLTITEGANGTAVTLEGGDFQVDAEHLEVGPAFTLNGSGRLVLLISSENVVLPSVSGTGSLYLDGTGSVDALNVAAFGGTFAFGKGVRLVTFPRPIEGAVLWLDASARDSLVMSGDDVHEWYDVRDGAFGKTYPHAFLTTRLAAWDRDKSSFPPTRITDETLAPKAVIDFGPQNSGKWFAFSSDVPAQTIFYVIGSQNGGGCCFFSYSYNSTGICRNGNVDGTIKASDGLYNPANWSSPLFAQSYTRKNGNVCNPTTTGLSGGYDTIATRLSTIQPLDGMAKDLRPLTGGHADGPKRSGGMRFAEIIIYDRALSDAEIASVEAYLNGKWFKRVVTTDAGSVWNGTLRIDDENTIEVSPQSAALSVNELIGTGTLVKLGEGELQLDYLENFEGSLRVEEGDLTLGQTIPEPAFWTDASQSASIGTDADGRFYWRDRRWDDVTDYIVATQRWATAPTVMQNELNGLPVVALGSLSTSHDRGLQWSRTVNAAAIFMVIGSQYSGGTILGTDDGDCLFNRGNIANASTPIFHATWAHANIRNGLTRLDGVQVDGTKTGFSGGYQVLAIRPTAPVKVGQFAHDRELDATKTRDGGQRLGEVLIFTNSLTDIQFRIVEDYLYKRWIVGQTTRKLFDAEGAAEQAASGVEATGTAAMTLNVAPGASVALNTLTGDAAVEKYGDSRLTVYDVSGFAGTMTVRNGTFALGSLAEQVLADATFWVDASRLDTITLKEGTQEVLTWKDCRFNGRYAKRDPLEQIYVNGTLYPNLSPTLLENELNGLPVVDFGEWMGNRFLVFDRPILDIRTVFWVIGSQQGGGILLGYAGSTQVRDFYRAGLNGSQDFNTIVAANPIWARNVAGPVRAVCDAPTRLNGEDIDGAAVGLSGGYDIVSVRATANVRASAFGMDRDRAYRNSTGGQRLAEVIIFNRVLSDDETTAVERYLSRKWDQPVTHAAPAAAGAPLASLLVTRGATLAFSLYGDYLIGALGGIGTVEAAGGVTTAGLHSFSVSNGEDEEEEDDGEKDRLAVNGDLTVADGAEWLIDATEGTPAPIIVSGDLAFLGGGTVRITGDPGNEPVLVAQGGTVTGFDASTWSVASDGSKRYILKAYPEEQAIYLELSAGTVMIIR